MSASVDHTSLQRNRLHGFLLPAALTQPQVWRQAAGLLLLGTLLGVVVNAWRPTGALPWRYPWDQHVAIQAREAGFAVWEWDRVQTAVQQGAGWLLDARPEEQYWEGALPGALSLSFADRTTAFAALQPMLIGEGPLITYCSGPDCDEALQLGYFLREQGYTNVVVFVGGVEAWTAAGQLLEGGL